MDKSAELSEILRDAVSFIKKDNQLVIKGEVKVRLNESNKKLTEHLKTIIHSINTRAYVQVASSMETFSHITKKSHDEKCVLL